MQVRHDRLSSTRSSRFQVAARRTLGALAAVVFAVGLVAAGSPSAPARADSASDGPDGAFVAASGRVYDTRPAGNSALPPNVWRTIPLVGQSGLPASGVSAVVVSATVVTPTAKGSF